MATVFDKLPEEVISKYEPILAKPIEQIKKELKALVTDYYKAVIEKDNILLESVVNEINSYVELDVPEFDNYLTYCLLTSINELLVKLYGTDLELYVPKPTDLTFNTTNDRKAKAYIEKNNLSSEDVELIVNFNVESLEIYSLSFLGYDMTSLKPKTVLPSYLLEEHFLLNTNYTAEQEIESTAKLFYAMDKHFKGVNLND